MAKRNFSFPIQQEIKKGRLYLHSRGYSQGYHEGNGLERCLTRFNAARCGVNNCCCGERASNSRDSQSSCARRCRADWPLRSAKALRTPPRAWVQHPGPDGPHAPRSCACAASPAAAGARQPTIWAASWPVVPHTKRVPLRHYRRLSTLSSSIMMGDAFAPVNLFEEGGQEAKGEQARMVRPRHTLSLPPSVSTWVRDAHRAPRPPCSPP